MPGEPFAADPDPAPSGPESTPSPLPPQPPADSPPAPPAAVALLGLDRQGLIEAAAGTVIALIALFSSYDHITLTSRTIPLQQQWGVWLIAASLALVFVDAQLATRSRLREAHERAEERYRAAERAERQRQAVARLHACSLLGGRFQLDPSPANSSRYRAVLALMADQAYA